MITRGENIKLNLNLKSFLLLWICIPLLGLAALQVQILIQFIFLLFD